MANSRGKRLNLRAANAVQCDVITRKPQVAQWDFHGIFSGSNACGRPEFKVSTIFIVNRKIAVPFETMTCRNELRIKNRCRKSEGFLLTPLCSFGNKFVKRGIGDRLVSFTAARAGVTQAPRSRLRDSGPSGAKETCEIYSKLVSSYCSKFSTFLSFPLSSAMVLLVFLSFFACLLSLNRQIEAGVSLPKAKL